MKTKHTKEEQQESLHKILVLEANEADWGAKAALASKEHALKYSEFKKHDKVEITINNYSKKAYGIISLVKFNTHEGFVYIIKPTNDTFGKTKRKSSYIYRTINLHPSEVKLIKKATE